MWKYVLIASSILVGGFIEEVPAQEYGGYISGEINCLVENVFHEARGESEDGWKAVMEVTLNRVKSEKWPNTICDVVYQPKQFSWTSDPNNKYVSSEHAKFQEIKKEVLDWLINGYQPITQKSNHYATIDTHRKWMKKMSYVTTIGSHKFFRG